MHIRDFTGTITARQVANGLSSRESRDLRLEAFRAVFRFCWESDWIPSNPAIKLKLPKITDLPTMPFSREEVIQILAACGQYRGGRANAQRLRALVQLLRFSGL